MEKENNKGNIKDIHNVNFESRISQNPPTDTKKKKKDRVLLVHDEQHRKVKQEAFRTEREMRDITSEAIDFYFKHRE